MPNFCHRGHEDISYHRTKCPLCEISHHYRILQSNTMELEEDKAELEEKNISLREAVESGHERIMRIAKKLDKIESYIPFYIDSKKQRFMWIIRKLKK